MLGFGIYLHKKYLFPITKRAYFNFNDYLFIYVIIFLLRLNARFFANSQNQNKNVSHRPNFYSLNLEALMSQTLHPRLDSSFTQRRTGNKLGTWSYKKKQSVGKLRMTCNGIFFVILR